jgi:hypothetical protein
MEKLGDDPDAPVGLHLNYADATPGVKLDTGISP